MLDTGIPFNSSKYSLLANSKDALCFLVTLKYSKSDKFPCLITGIFFKIQDN